jgi:hypothetical protein
LWRTFPSLTSATPPPALMPHPLGVFAAPPVTLQKIGKKKKKYRKKELLECLLALLSLSKKRKDRKKQKERNMRLEWIYVFSVKRICVFFSQKKNLGSKTTKHTRT